MLSTPSERVAATIRAELARRRKTQSDLATALGMARSALHRRLNGDQSLTVDELHKIAKYLDLSASYLIESGESAGAA